VGPLVDVRAYFLLILPVRLALGLAGLAAARAFGVSQTASVWLFGLGAGLFALAMLPSRRRQTFFARAGEAEAIKGPITVQSRARTLARSAFPSTLAVSALTAIALPIDAGLAALLAGILAGMALFGLVFGIELVTWERDRGVRLLSAPDQGGKLFIRPAE
jgi:hypothetical protein